MFCNHQNSTTGWL